MLHYMRLHTRNSEISADFLVFDVYIAVNNFCGCFKRLFDSNSRLLGYLVCYGEIDWPLCLSGPASMCNEIQSELG